jgi:hypothetical protein
MDWPISMHVLTQNNTKIDMSQVGFKTRIPVFVRLKTLQTSAAMPCGSCHIFKTVNYKFIIILFKTPQRPNMLWRPPSLLSNEHRGFFPLGLSCWNVRLITHFSIVPMLRMSGTTTLFPYTSVFGGT